MALLLASPAQAALHSISVLTQGQGTSRELAKEQAMELAKAQAINQVATKLDADKARAFVAKLDATEAEALIRGVTVEKEQRVGDVYYARVRVVVVDGPIRRAYGEVVSEDPADHVRKMRTVLVLPVFFDGKEAVVWDVKRNTTFPMWVDKAFTVAHGSIVVPGGDPKERAIVDRDNVLTVKYDELKPLLENYGSDEMVVVVVTDALLTEAKDEVQVMMRRIREGGEKIESFAVTPDKGTSAKRDVVYEKAVQQAAEMIAGLAQSTSHLEVTERKDATKMQVVVQFTTLKDWGILQQKIRIPEEFVGIDVRNLRLHEANATIYVEGPVELYVAKIRNQGVDVDAVGAGLWSMRSHKGL